MAVKGEGRPSNTPVPSWLTGEVLPCISPPRTTLPPKCWPIDWWPRHTPSSGFFASAQAATRSRLTPASLGVQGPGEIRKPCALLGERFGRGDRVVAHHLHLGAQLHHVMDQVPGEAVVIVDDEDHDAPAFARFSTTIKGPIGKPLSSRPLCGVPQRRHGAVEEQRVLHLQVSSM